MQVWNVLHVARWKCRTQKLRKKSPSGHHPTTLLCYIFTTKACINNRKKNLLSSNICSRCPHNMVNFGLLAAEIVSGVWGTPATFNGFRVLAALLHGSQVVSVSKTLRRWIEGATYVPQGDHHVGHWLTFLVKKDTPWCSLKDSLHRLILPSVYTYCSLIIGLSSQWSHFTELYLLVVSTMMLPGAPVTQDIQQQQHDRTETCNARNDKNTRMGFFMD